MALAEQQTQRSSGSIPTGRTQPAKSGPGAPKGNWQAKMPPGRTWLWLLGILLANYLLMRYLLPSPDAPVTVPYTFFKKEVANRNVEAIHSQGEIITGRFKAPVTYPPPVEKIAVPSSESKTASEKSAAPSSESKNAAERGATPGGTPK